MANAPDPQLRIEPGCDDCGLRQVELPADLPPIPDDLDWDLRDYDSFRLFMLEELIARFPERKRWTPADLEVTIIEALAAVLDQLSDTLDRVAREAYLETARRPESVRRLLLMIGYDACGLYARQGLSPFADSQAESPDNPCRANPIDQLEQYWLDHPEEMERARQAGPRTLHTQHRMVTAADYAQELQAHPLVERAQAWERWTGSWSRLYVAVIPWRQVSLDAEQSYDDALWDAIKQFHAQRAIALPDRDVQPTIRSILRPYLDNYRMLGQEVQLVPAEEVGIQISLSVQVSPNYFQSEIRRALERALGNNTGGFFEPGRLRFGEDLWASDVFEQLMQLDGVENLCLNRFKRIGAHYNDRSEQGHIPLSGLEVAVCDNDRQRPERGYYYLRLRGGRRG